MCPVDVLSCTAIPRLSLRVGLLMPGETQASLAPSAAAGKYGRWTRDSRTGPEQVWNDLQERQINDEAVKREEIRSIQ